METPKIYQQDLYDFQQRCRDFMNEHIVQSNKLFEDAEKIKTANAEELADLRCQLMAREELSGENKRLGTEVWRLERRVEYLEGRVRYLKTLEAGPLGWWRRLWAKGGE